MQNHYLHDYLHGLHPRESGGSRFMCHPNDPCPPTVQSWILSAGLAALLALSVAGCSSSTSPTTTPPPNGTTNFVYTANAAGSPSTVSALMSDPTSGALTPISNSPYNTGSGSRAVQATATGKFLYVANSSSGDISAFSINATTGTLTVVANSPFGAEAGIDAIVIDPTGSYLYAASGSSGNLWEFSIDTGGALHNLASSPVLVDPAVTLSAALVDPSGKYLYVAGSDSLSSNLYPFTRDSTSGAVSPIAVSPYPIDHSGNDMATDPAGKFVLVASTGASTLFGTIDVFSLDSTTGKLSVVANSPSHTGVDPSSVTVEPSGKFVYVANNADATVSAFTLDGTSGALTPVANSPFPSGGNGSINGPTGIVADASGQYVYVCNASNDISVFKLNSQTGALSALANSPFPAGGNGPSSITVVQKK
jgi:6-phosphogluconolactonase